MVCHPASPSGLRLDSHSSREPWLLVSRLPPPRNCPQLMETVIPNYTPYWKDPVFSDWLIHRDKSLTFLSWTGTTLKRHLNYKCPHSVCSNCISGQHLPLYHMAFLKSNRCWSHWCSPMSRHAHTVCFLWNIICNISASGGLRKHTLRSGVGHCTVDREWKLHYLRQVEHWLPLMCVWDAFVKLLLGDN